MHKSIGQFLYELKASRDDVVQFRHYLSQVTARRTVTEKDEYGAWRPIVFKIPAVPKDADFAFGNAAASTWCSDLGGIVEKWLVKTAHPSMTPSPDLNQVQQANNWLIEQWWDLWSPPIDDSKIEMFDF